MGFRRSRDYSIDIAVLAMKVLWTKTESEFHGKYYDFPPVYSFPRPVQRPHPPVFLGGMARNVLKRVVAWGDGWIPNRVTPDQVKEGRTTLNRLAKEAGQDPASIKLFVSGQSAYPEIIKRYEDAGVEQVVVRVATADEEETLAELERAAEAVLA